MEVVRKCWCHHAKRLSVWECWGSCLGEVWNCNNLAIVRRRLFSLLVSAAMPPKRRYDVGRVERAAKDPLRRAQNSLGSDVALTCRRT